MSIDYLEFFAGHKLDIGMDTDFKMKLTPKDNKTVNSQNPSMPVLWKGNLFTVLAQLYKRGKLILLPFSQSASSFFAQKKPTENFILLLL